MAAHGRDGTALTASTLAARHRPASGAGLVLRRGGLRRGDTMTDGARVRTRGLTGTVETTAGTRRARSGVEEEGWRPRHCFLTEPGISNDADGVGMAEEWLGPATMWTPATGTAAAAGTSDTEDMCGDSLVVADGELSSAGRLLRQRFAWWSGRWCRLAAARGDLGSGR
jgi:hypothetical protein